MGAADHIIATVDILKNGTTGIGVLRLALGGAVDARVATATIGVVSPAVHLVFGTGRRLGPDFRASIGVGPAVGFGRNARSSIWAVIIRLEGS